MKSNLTLVLDQLEKTTVEMINGFELGLGPSVNWGEHANRLIMQNAELIDRLDSSRNMCDTVNRMINTDQPFEL